MLVFIRRSRVANGIIAFRIAGGPATLYQLTAMVHIPDLTPMEHPQLVAVGWLAGGQPYERGPVSEDFVHALFDLLEDPWQPCAAAGFHRCDLCRISGGPARLEYRGRSISLGVRNLHVPGDDKIFVSPSLIAHYIDAHEYAPPEPYQHAVLQCPPMRSIEYLKAILKNAPPGFTGRDMT